MHARGSTQSRAMQLSAEHTAKDYYRGLSLETRTLLSAIFGVATVQCTATVPKLQTAKSEFL